MHVDLQPEHKCFFCYKHDNCYVTVLQSSLCDGPFSDRASHIESCRQTIDDVYRKKQESRGNLSKLAIAKRKAVGLRRALRK
jgi:hypothetical protein